jgi:hypothetical protein
MIFTIHNIIQIDIVTMCRGVQCKTPERGFGETPVTQALWDAEENRLLDPVIVFIAVAQGIVLETC